MKRPLGGTEGKDEGPSPAPRVLAETSLPVVASSEGDRQVEEKRREPAVEETKWEVTFEDPNTWIPCDSKCGYWCTGTRAPRHCCLVCIGKPGTHGKLCKKHLVRDGRPVQATRPAEVKQGACEHGEDPAVCRMCRQRHRWKREEKARSKCDQLEEELPERPEEEMIAKRVAAEERKQHTRTHT